MREKLKCLKTYRNRQVVLNYYEQDELTNKDGFFFDLIAFTHDKIVFWKHEKQLASLPICDDSDFYQMDGFSRYYSLATGGNRIEIYFP